MRTLRLHVGAGGSHQARTLPLLPQHEMGPLRSEEAQVQHVLLQMDERRRIPVEVPRVPFAPMELRCEEVRVRGLRQDLLLQDRRKRAIRLPRLRFIQLGMRKDQMHLQEMRIQRHPHPRLLGHMPCMRHRDKAHRAHIGCSGPVRDGRHGGGDPRGAG